MKTRSVAPLPLLVRVRCCRPKVSGRPPAARAGHTATLIGHKMFVLGGGDHRRVFRDVHVLELNSMVWSKPSVTGELPHACAAHTATAIGALVIVFGGASPQGSMFNDMFVMDTGVLTQMSARLLAPFTFSLLLVFVRRVSIAPR
jgi:hypothetical protein